MRQPIECLVGEDLLPWEKLYFESFLGALGQELEFAWIKKPAEVSGKSPVWILARQWRRLVKQLPKNLKTPVWVSVVGVEPAPRFLGFFSRGWNPAPHLDVRLITHSPFANRYLKEFEHVPESHLVALALPGILSDVQQVNSGTLRIGSLSPLNIEANLAFLVSVAHYLKERHVDFKFVLPAQGKLATHLQAMVKDLKLESHFETMGPDYAMDVLLHAPWKSEHFVPVLWKAAQGIPVLSTDIPGIEELISDGHDGFILAVNEVRPVGELLCRLAENLSLRTSLGERLRQSLAKRFALDRVVEQYVKLFRGPLSKSIARAAA